MDSERILRGLCHGVKRANMMKIIPCIRFPAVSAAGKINERNAGKRRFRYILLIFIMIAGGTYIRYFTVLEKDMPDRPLKDFPRIIKNWKTYRDIELSREVIETLKVDDYIFRDFHNGNKKVTLYIGYYKSHRKFGEIHTPEHCQVGGGWEVVRERKKYIEMPGSDKKIKFIEAVYKKDNEKRVFIFWYQLPDRYVTNFFSYKIHVVLNSLFKHRSDAAFIRITTTVLDNNIEDALLRAEDFLIKIAPVISRTLP